ncbi:hypothetical protein [Vibrio sp. Hal054]|uniref:hypothetical protein n=1 Tax=Vibrio sp. Hal054 TaxID=3035158 RepID=UPI00301BDD84
MTENVGMREKNNTKRGRPTLDEPLDEKLEIRCSTDHKKLWAEASQEHGSVSDWARETLTRCAKRAIKKKARENDTTSEK